MTTFTNISQASFVGVHPIFADKLKVFIEHIKGMKEEKAGMSSDIKGVYSEDKGTDFDTGALRKITPLLRKYHTERQEEDAILEMYMQELGMV